MVYASAPEASILGGGGAGGQPPPNENIGGAKPFVLPPPPPIEKLIICNARIGLKSTVMHYKTIKFNIKIPLNIHNFHFCGALRAKSLIFRIYTRSAPIFFLAIFQIPPPPIRKMDRHRCSAPPPPHTSKKLPTPLAITTTKSREERKKVLW